MRAYDVAAAAEALGVDAKRLDNLLSRHEIPGVRRGRQGVSRRLSPEAIVIIRIALALADTVGVPLDAALRLAARLEKEGGEGQAIRIDGDIWIGADVGSLRTETGERLDAAVESVVHRPRGRPARGRKPTSSG